MGKNEVEENEKSVADYMELGEYEALLKEMDSRILKNGYKMDYYYIKARCFLELNRLEEALKEAMAALIQGYPANMCNELFLKIYNNMGDITRTQDYFLKTLKFQPNSIVEFKRIAYLKYNLYGKSDAEKFIRMAVRINPDNPEVLRYAFNYYVENKFELVLKSTLDKYLECEVNETAKFEMRGDFEAYFGNYKKAEEYFEEAASIDPVNSDIIEKLKKAKNNSGVLAKVFRISLRVLEYIFAAIAMCVVLFLIIFIHLGLIPSVLIGIGVYMGLTSITKVRTII